MISLIEALNYRCLRHISQPLGPFHVLVGPNASGKSTFLDVIQFLSELIRDELETAVKKRTPDFRDLVWQRSGASLELAVEATIPEDLRRRLAHREYDTVRYETRLGPDAETLENSILAEKVLLKRGHPRSDKRRESFASESIPVRDTILTPEGQQGTRTVIARADGRNGSFYPEVGEESETKWDGPWLHLGPSRSGLGFLLEDEGKFPISTWLKHMLIDGVESLALSSVRMRKPSPRGQPRRFRADGANLPWVIESLAVGEPGRFGAWADHLRTALPDLQVVKTIERPEDRHRYVVTRLRGGVDVPSWMISDGTLRLMALTVVAYLQEKDVLYLIEEPENGVHPGALQAIFDSLSSVYDGQVLIATYSPMIVGLAEPEHILCFTKDTEGGTEVVAGVDHPALREWKRETDLGTLFASGLLG